MDGGHETFNNGELVVDDLGERCKTVGCARSVGDDRVLGVVLVEVDTADEHGGISGGGGDDDLLGTTLQVGRGPGEERTVVSIMSMEKKEA